MPAKASQANMPEDLRRAIAAAATAAEIDHFRQTLRNAIATAPQHKLPILLHAIELRPDWAAELLLAALFDPPLRGQGPPETPLEGAPRAPQRGQHALSPALVEAPPDEAPDPVPWYGSLELGGVARSGNTENLGISAGAELTYEEAPWTHKASAALDYLRTRSDTEAQSLEAEYEINYELTERSFLFGLTHFQNDRFSGFDYEITSSAGLGVKLIAGVSMTWTLAAGPSLRVFRREDKDRSETTPGARVNNDVAWQVSDTATLANETEIRLDSERSEVENEASLTLKIIESLAGKFSFTANYRSPVPADTEKLDTTTRASLIYDF
ncbi:YdiY family protein [Pelagibius sp.]|uniref:DUF481 domain-containing protein n=1 Tax=Pelagibius sp. TaxID=1931238 RepID=UPI002631460A|nr:DUF481 domain-containing protein [Pelagibius sp.]